MGPLRLDAPPTPCNVIVGADAGFLETLAAGTLAVSDYLAATEARLREQWQAQIDKTEVEV